MNKYKEALDEIKSIVLDESGDGYRTPKYLKNFYFSSCETLQELVDKADSFEWIPVSERLPEPPRENEDFYHNKFDLYLVSIDGGHTVIAFWDGKKFGDGPFTLDVKAWMPLPKLYEEKENDC